MRSHQVCVERSELRPKFNGSQRQFDVGLIVRLHLSAGLLSKLLQFRYRLLLHQIIMHLVRAHRVIETLDDSKILINAFLTSMSLRCREPTRISEVPVDVHCLGEVWDNLLSVRGEGN